MQLPLNEQVSTYTGVLYASPHVRIAVAADGSRSVVATAALPAGALVLHEHILCASSDSCIWTVSCNADLRTWLAPRAATDAAEWTAMEDFYDAARAKVLANAFLRKTDATGACGAAAGAGACGASGGELFGLCKAGSAFNHSCAPNTVSVRAGRMPMCEGYTAYFTAFYTAKAVKAGEELRVRNVRRPLAGSISHTGIRIWSMRNGAAAGGEHFA